MIVVLHFDQKCIEICETILINDSKLATLETVIACGDDDIRDRMNSLGLPSINLASYPCSPDFNSISEEVRLDWHSLHKAKLRHGGTLGQAMTYRGIFILDVLESDLVALQCELYMLCKKLSGALSEYAPHRVILLGGITRFEFDAIQRVVTDAGIAFLWRPLLSKKRSFFPVDMTYRFFVRAQASDPCRVSVRRLFRVILLGVLGIARSITRLISQESLQTRPIIFVCETLVQYSGIRSVVQSFAVATLYPWIACPWMPLRARPVWASAEGGEGKTIISPDTFLDWTSFGYLMGALISLASRSSQLCMDDGLVESLRPFYFRSFPLSMIEFLEAVEKIELAFALVRRARPSVVVLTNESTKLQRAICLVSNQLGVETITVPHTPVGWEATYDCFHARVVALPGDADFTRLRTMRDVKRCTTTRSALLVTGAPKYDSTFSKARSCKRVFINNGRRIGVGFVTSMVGRAMSMLMARELFSYLATSSSYDLILRLHPREHADGSIAKLASDVMPNVKLIVDESTMEDFLDKCVFVVAMPSTAILECIIFGKPVVEVLIGYGAMMDEVQFKAVIPVYRRGDFAYAFQRALTQCGHADLEHEMARESFLDSHFYGRESSATYRVKELIASRSKLTANTDQPFAFR